MNRDYKKWRRDLLVIHLRKELRLISVPEKVIIALSGGVDSTGLLLAAVALQKQDSMAPKIHAVHINHGLRSESRLEALHVKNLTASLGVSLDIIELRLRPGTSSAEARKAREESLYHCATEIGSKEVWTAHHAGDQAESIILSLARGTNSPGFGSIHRLRPLFGDVLLRRPLLSAQRTDFIRICKLAGVDWVEDPTNADENKPRGKVRHQILPILESLYPGATLRISNSSKQELSTVNFVEMPTDGWCRDMLSSYSLEMLGTILRNHIKTKYPNLLSRMRRMHFIEAARLIHDSQSRNRSINWPSGMKLHIKSNIVLIENQK